MKYMVLGSVFASIAVLVSCTVSGYSDPTVPQPEIGTVQQSGKHLRAFGSEKELKDFFDKIEKKRDERRSKMSANSVPTSASPSESAAAKSADDAESVTNTQHAGVDEGGIVKVHGNNLVILRRGKLFTVAIGDNDLRPISSHNAFGPDIDPNGTWYDEMLISGDTIAVIGYSYARGGTEVGLFTIDQAGELAYGSTYHLRSNDYYSSRNYASRLIGNKLIFYSPMYLNYYGGDLKETLPAVRKWRKGATNDDFERITPASRIYLGSNDVDNMPQTALHTVTVCDLGRGNMECEATALIGPAGNVFYVSPSSVYVWTSDYYSQETGSTLYKMPLDGSAPSALKTKGSPVDQFSFLESNDGYLNVLVRSNGSGNWMWNAETTSGEAALMRVGVNSFSDGTDAVADENYRALPKPKGYSFQNRFVGGYLLYGTGAGWQRNERSAASELFAVKWNGDGDVERLQLPHGVDRIEALGTDAVVVGSGGNDLYFSAVSLRNRPELRGRYVYENGSQGELRSHGFFYKPDGNNSGILGLPVRGGSEPRYAHLRRDSASILFLRNTSLNFSEIGELDSQTTGVINDGCQASCVDWYGNARPLFIKGRTFALLGYEIVEGTLKNGTLTETRRISYAPDRRVSNAE
ncbi:MAG: beta-propeller domain-containing protein [Acidobacteria bacterium]|nr:beta-propeller domain-containing protein [Acidobacteriota bacterium]